MKNIYKLQFRQQKQINEKGNVETHNRVSITLPAPFINDMGLNASDNEVFKDYEEDTKTITIKKN